MSFAADVKNELCKAEHSRKQLELLSKGAAYAMTEDGEATSPQTRKIPLRYTPKASSPEQSGIG